MQLLSEGSKALYTDCCSDATGESWTPNGVGCGDHKPLQKLILVTEHNMRLNKHLHLIKLKDPGCTRQRSRSFFKLNPLKSIFHVGSFVPAPLDVHWLLQPLICSVDCELGELA